MVGETNFIEAWYAMLQRYNPDIAQEAKLRLTRNHIQRLSKIYVNAITSLAPGVTMEPSNPKELQDQFTSTKSR